MVTVIGKVMSLFFFNELVMRPKFHTKNNESKSIIRHFILLLLLSRSDHFFMWKRSHEQ